MKTFKHLRHPLLDKLPLPVSAEELKVLFSKYQKAEISKEFFIEACLARSSKYLSYLYATKQFPLSDFDDIMSEVSFRIVQLAGRQGQWQIDSPTTYLYVLIRNAIVSIYRRQSREQLSANLDTFHQPEITPVVDCIESLEQAVLDDLDKDIVRLRAQNKTLREVSEDLGISHSAVHRRLQTLYQRYCTLIGE